METKEHKQQAFIRVSYEKLAELLDIPSGNTVIDVLSERQDREYNVISVKIQGPGMYQVPESTPVPYLNGS
jgi:hypothetical protein